MSGQRASTTTRTARKGNHPQVEVEVRTISSTRDALADINRFIQGQAEQPDAPLQFDALLQDINLLMDDELIEALDHVEKGFAYNAARDADDMERAYPVRELLSKLRNLQKVRLRDAMQRLLVQRPN